MPYHAVEKVVQALDSRDRALRNARILVLGVAFKKDIDDARNSAAERVIELLLAQRAQVVYNDPYIPRFEVGGNAFHREKEVLESVPLDHDRLAWADCVLVVAAHSAYDYQHIVDTADLVVDTCNATKGIAGGDKVFKIGRSR